MFCCCLLQSCSFLMRKRKEVDQKNIGVWEELGEAGRCDTVIRISCTRAESIFNKKKKIKKNCKNEINYIYNKYKYDIYTDRAINTNPLSFKTNILYKIFMSFFCLNPFNCDSCKLK